jgi:replicative DNA helicase
MHFKEGVFVKSLTERREDARRFGTIFRPDWLETAQLRPILATIYEFLSKYDTPPSLTVLHEIFSSRDESQYKNRYKKILEDLEAIPADIAEILFTLDKAKDVAVVRSLSDLTSSADFASMSEEFDGTGQIKGIQNWIYQFSESSDEVELDIKEGIERLVKERGINTPTARIKCGVDIVDDWAGGGLRPKNLGIVLAPTGHGKSMFLTVIAYKMATVERKNVLYITNEISWEETVERFLSKITGEKLQLIMDDPTIAYHGLERHWKMGLDDRLRIIDVNKEVDSDYIEAAVARYINLYGWAPEVIVIDFMERMKPLASGIRRDQSWNWYGAIAKDLVRMAKRNSWLIWTAGQTNRGGYNRTKEQGLDDAQGSVQHLQEAALVLAMRQIDGYPLPDKESTLLQFKALKMRQHIRQGDSAYVIARLGRVNITNKTIAEEDIVNAFGDNNEEETDDKKLKKKKGWKTKF